MKFKRSSGVLLHITSLPGAYGIGDIGPSAYKFLDFLEGSGHTFWQLLPLNPTENLYHHSPYSSHSAFAGNPLLVSPELLERDGWLEPGVLRKFKTPNMGAVDYERAVQVKEQILQLAWETFRDGGKNSSDFTAFQKEHAHWLDDYALYMALRSHLEKERWKDWPRPLRDRHPEALKKKSGSLADPIKKEKFTQFLFFTQWKKLVQEAHHRKLKFFGDIPFYINHDSVDCWVNPSIFRLDKKKDPTHISGVPPDLFSKTGQLWGTPVYDWDELRKIDYSWWISRLRQNLLLFDVVRLDHFRAFSAYWEVPAAEKTAEKGVWIRTPGVDFFKTVSRNFPQMPFVAEDLGSLDQPVYDLLDHFNFPRMKVLQFAFGEDWQNPYLPFNHLPRDVVYTGTHDNNTSVGWFREAGTKEKRHLRRFTGKRINSRNVHQVLHRLALQSVAKLCIVPMQDLLGLGEEAIMNVPGSTQGNWKWRMRQEDFPTPGAIDEFLALNSLYGRTR